MMYLPSKSPIRKKNKVTFSLAFLLVFLYIWILFGWNTGNADYLNYKNIYDLIGQYGGYSAVEVGFEFICRIAIAIGLSYNGFLVIYSFVGLFMIASTVRKYTKNITFVFVLYFFYPFLLDVVQIRNFMSMAIIIFAIRYLVTNKKKDYIKYIIFVLIASTVHKSALFYMLFLLVKIKSYKKLTFIISVILIFGTLLNSILPDVVYQYFAMDRYSSYFSYSTSIYAKILTFVYLGANIFLVYYSYKRIKNDKNLAFLYEADNKRENQIEFVEIMMKINIIVLTAFVLIIVDVDFMRLFRNILPLNYILFSMPKAKNKITKNADNFIHNCCFIAFVALSSWAFIFLRTYESVVYAIFNNNSIMDFFK